MGRRANGRRVPGGLSIAAECDTGQDLNGDVSILEYASAQVSQLLETLAANLHTAAGTGDAESIHDFRVSVRRFVQGLRTFEDFFPARMVRNIRSSLKELMSSSSAIRNLDIAFEFLDAVKPPRAALRERLTRERDSLQGEFAAELELWNQLDFNGRWRAGLGLPAQ